MSHLSWNTLLYPETKCNCTGILSIALERIFKKRSLAKRFYPEILESMSVHLSSDYIIESMEDKCHCIQPLTKP